MFGFTHLQYVNKQSFKNRKDKCTLSPRWILYSLSVKFLFQTTMDHLPQFSKCTTRTHGGWKTFCRLCDHMLHFLSKMKSVEGRVLLGENVLTARICWRLRHEFGEHHLALESFNAFLHQMDFSCHWNVAFNKVRNQNTVYSLVSTKRTKWKIRRAPHIHHSNVKRNVN